MFSHWRLSVCHVLSFLADWSRRIQLIPAFEAVQSESVACPNRPPIHHCKDSAATTRTSGRTNIFYMVEEVEK